MGEVGHTTWVTLTTYYLLLAKGRRGLPSSMPTSTGVSIWMPTPPPPSASSPASCSTSSSAVRRGPMPVVVVVLAWERPVRGLAPSDAASSSSSSSSSGGWWDGVGLGVG